MTRRTITAIATLALLASGSAASAQEVYKCDMTSQGSGGWVGPLMFFILNRDVSFGAVLDGITRSVQEDPMPATITKRDEVRWVYRWVVEDVKTSNDGESKLTYRAMLNTQNGTVTVSGRLHGFDNQISGRGSCKRES